MNFEIPCETYIRLCGLTKQFSVRRTEEERASLRCVRLEIKNGARYAIAANGQIGAVYYLGQIDAADEFAHLNADETLIAQCEIEKQYNASLIVTAIQMLNVVTVASTFGYNYPGNVGSFPAATHLENWRTWAPSEPVTKSKGAMGWSLDQIEALNAASPSGRIAFPAFIDHNKPVILRDRKFDNWIGFFMPNAIDDITGEVKAVEPAVLPEWW